MKKPSEDFAGYVFFICLIVYFFSAKGYLEVSDSFYSLETAQAIVTHGELQIPSAPGYTLQGSGGANYSKYGLGLAFYYLPIVTVGDALVKGSAGSVLLFNGFLLSFASIPFVLLTLMIFNRLLCRFEVPPRFAAICLLGLGLGTLAWRYACYDFSEGMQMGLLLLTVYGLIRRTPRTMLAGGIGFAWLFLVKEIYIVYLPVLLVYLFACSKNWSVRVRWTALFLFPSIVAWGIVLWLNFVRFGNPFESGYGREATRFYPAQVWRTAPALLVSLNKGLLIYCPILLVGFIGWRAFARKHRAEALLCGALIAENLLITAAWYGWKGDWCWGPRFLVPAIPLWLLPLAFLERAWQSRKLQWAIAIAVFVSAATQIPGVLVGDREIHTIKEVLLSPAEQPSAPSDYVAAWILLKHKLFDGNDTYKVSELHVPGNRVIEANRERAFAGLNVWTEHLAHASKLSSVRWYPLFGLFLIGFFAIQLVKSLETGT